MDDYPNIDDENFQFSLSQHLEFVNLDNIDGPVSASRVCT